MSRFCGTTAAAAVVVVVFALVATSAAGPVNSCALQNDTVIGRSKLSTLDGLFGELLTTESNGNIYFVSICRPIPQPFYDPRKLSGAVKLTSDGQTIDLGHIDQTNVIVNEDTIVLTYVGGDRDTNPKDDCKGLGWKTYVIFSCDVSATDDVLTLVDEDPDQPEICQVWFEIQTSKTCVRHPHVPLDILDKDLLRQYKQVISERRARKTEAYLNNSSIHNKLSNNEHSKLNTYQHFSKSEAKQINSSNASSGEEPFIHTTSYPIIENKSINNEKKENDFHKRIPEDKDYENEKNNINPERFEDNPFININPNHIIETKFINHEREEKDFHQKHLHEISSEDKPFVNKNLHHENNEKEENYFHQNHSYKNNSEEEPFTDKNPNYIADKIINNEKKENDFHKSIPEDKVYENEKNNINPESSENKPFNNINPNHIIETKFINHEREEKDFHQKHLHDISSEDKPLVNKNLNHENNEKEENARQSAPVEKSSTRNIKNNEDRVNNKFPNGESFQNTNSENNYSKSQNYKLGKDFKHENNDLKNEISSSNIPNGNHYYEKNRSDKNENNRPYEIEDYIAHQHRNSDSPINNRNEISESTNTENRNENFHKNVSEGTPHDKEKHSSISKIDTNEEKRSRQHIFENRSSENDADNLNKNKERVGGENRSHTNHFPHKKSEEKSVQNINEHFDKGNSIDNHIVKPNKSLPNTHYNSESEPLHGRYYNSLSENNTSNGHEVEDLNRNNSTNIYFKPVTDYNSNAVEDIKRRNDGLSHMKFDVNKNQSGEVENVSVKKYVNGLHNYNRPNDKQESNGTYFINRKYTENAPTERRSESEVHESPIDSSPSAHLSNIHDGDRRNSTSTTGLFGDIYLKFQNLYSKLFPNGIQLSTATILGGLGSIVAIFGLIGTAVNRFYYKQTGTDQIPFRGTLQRLYSFIKGFVTKLFCCCGRDSEEPETTNEKTPLLHPKNIVAPRVEDETSSKSGKHRKSGDDGRQQRSENSGNNKGSEQNNEKQYGSLLKERISPTPDKKYRKKKQKSKRSNTSSSDSGPENESWLYQDKEKLVKVESSLTKKSPKEEMINTKQSVTANEQVITPSELVFEKIGTKVESSNKEKKQELVRGVASFEPQYEQSSVQSNVTKPHDDIEIASSNKKDEIINVSETNAEDDDDESVEVIEEIVYVEDGEDEEEIIEEITETTTVEELPADQFDGSDLDKSQSLTGSGERERPTTVTVRTSVRKISSSSSPGQVKTIEERVVSDNSAKNVKKGFGIELGIGKSGVNMSVGEKKLGIGRLGMKFGKRKEQEDENEQEGMKIKLNKSGFSLHRKKNKSSLPTEGEDVNELDKRNVVSPEKNKKSKSKSISKLFKRSFSQPSVADISEIEDDPFPGGSIKSKFSNSSSSLFKFGKSRSRSSDHKKRTL